MVFPIASTKVGKPYAIAEHCVVSPDIACRELIQNSLDAHTALQNEEPCRVIFKVAKIRTEEIPGHSDYCMALEKALTSWKKNESVSIYLASIKKYLNQQELEVLYVIDNGKGFDGRGLEAVMAEGSPDKQEGSTGSFGIGHLTSYGMSGLQYICYASKQQDSTLLATGHAILSSHDSDGELHSNNGYYVKEYKPKFDEPFVFCEPEHIPPFLRDELEKMESPSGSIIAVLGFNRFRQEIGSKNYRKKELHELIREAIAENFAIAIWANHLEVEVYDTVGENELATILPQKVDQSSIEEFLKYMAKPETGTKEQTLKAQQTLDAIETYRRHSALGKLSGRFSDCKVYLRNRARAHSVSIWRNGMLITRKHLGLAKNQFDNKKPFDAVVMLAGKERPREAHDIVQRAETPLHDKIQEKRLPSKPEKMKLKEWFAEVRAWISDHAEESGGESANLEDEIILDGGDAMEAKLLRQPKIFTDSGVGETEPKDPRGPKNEKNSTRAKRPHVVRRLTKTKAQGRALPNNRYRVRIRPETDIAKGQLKVIIDSGQDPSCTGAIKDTSLVIQAANSPEPSRKIYDVNDGLIWLGDLKKGETVIIDLAFANPPENFQQISLGCLLGSAEAEA